MKRVMLSVVVTMFVLSTAAAYAAQISLNDGSFFIGEIKNERFRLKTGFGDLTPSIVDMASIEGNQVKFTDGNSVKGDLLLTDGLLVDTTYGTFKLEVTPEQINFIDFTGETKRKPRSAKVSEGMAKIGFKDGTVIVGELRNLDLTVKTKYGILRPTLPDIASVTDTLVTLKEGDSLKGDVDFGSERLIVKTAFGSFTFNTKSGDLAFVDFTGKLTSTDTGAGQAEEKEVAEFFDDFEKGPKPSWKPIAGDWTMAKGMYTVTNIQDGTWYGTFVEGKEWTNFVLSVDVKPGKSIGRRHKDDWCEASICPRILNGENGVCLWLGGRGHLGNFQRAGWRIGKEDKWGESVGVVDKETPEGKVVHIKIEVRNGVFTAYLDGTKLTQVYDNTFLSGSVGFGQWYQQWRDPKIRSSFDNLKVTPLD